MTRINSLSKFCVKYIVFDHCFYSTIYGERSVFHASRQVSQFLKNSCVTPNENRDIIILRYIIVILYYGIALYPTIWTMCYENVDMKRHYEESTFPICFSTNWIFADESGWFLWSRLPFRGLLRNKINSDDIRRILYFQFPCGHRNEIAFWQRWSTSWIEYFLFTAKSICSKSIVSCDLDA